MASIRPAHASGVRPVLLDRRSECEVLDHLISDVREGESRGLVLRGDAGIGKTALFDYALGQAAGCRAVRAAGVEAEKELAFAALHQICVPLLDRSGHLPAPQREALTIAFGLDVGNPPDRFMVGLAVLGLLAEVARDRPLLCLIDDAQWLDRASAQVLGFAARRLRAESLGMLFAVREAGDQAEVSELAGLPELHVSGLPDDDARALLASAHPGPLDDRVLDRIIAESQGNPLALMELPRGFTPAELAGGFGLFSSAALPRRIEESFRRQISTLSAATRQWLLVAAAEPVGDPVLVRRAVDQLGIDVETDLASRGEAAGFVEFGSRVTFRHPLLRSAIYRAATAEERRTAHRALAQVTDRVADPDRRAWHSARAASGTDEDVAAELERSAGRAQARGGMAAAAAFLERASELTPDPERWGQRALAAAQATHQAGMTEAASRLLVLADASPLDEFQRARADLLRGRIAFTMNRGHETPSLLLKAAAELEPFDLRLARDTYLDALRAGLFAAHLPGGTSLRDAADAARTAPVPVPARPSDLLLDGLAVRYTDGYAAGVPTLKQALQAFRTMVPLGDAGLRWLWYAGSTAVDLFDEANYDLFTGRLVQLARDSGALSVLPLALTIRINMQMFTGDLAVAGSLLEELHAVTDGIELRELPYAAQLLAAWQGRERRAADLNEVTVAESKRRGEGFGLIAAGWMSAVLYNGLGRYDEALAAARQATEPEQEVGVLTWSSLIEFVVAAAHTGRPESATEALERLAEMTQASGTDWALGVEACGRALVTEGPAAEGYYQRAIDHLARTHIRGQVARAHLHYGEWLRRQNRRSDARDHLHAAHEMFTAMGMDGFAELAAHELRATGETVRKRSQASSTQLTAQEAQIVRLVRDGLSNPEIAVRLFLSRRTVEWHLSKIFTKLKITSRRQLLR